MPVIIGHNIASLQAQRRLSEASASLSTTLERLSSGQRINHAGDDAAGLAVASALSAGSRIFAQANRNVNDGISLLNIADGATSSLKTVLFRLRELATQASNGTYSSVQRQALDTESRALQKEYNRIVQTTAFNGVRTFNGSSSDVNVQAGYGVSGILALQITANTSGDGTFQAKQSVTTGASPIAVSLGDFNGDGIADFVTSDLTGNTASVLIGNGDGTFQAKQSFASGAGPQGVVVSDFNGDGKADIVTADATAATASVLLGNGDGTFAAKISSVTGFGPRKVAFGDFNGDGKMDIASADTTSGTSSILLGNGDGTFLARRIVTLTSGVRAVVPGDVNGDGKLDLVAADTNAGTADVLIGNGDGTFRAALAFTAGSSPWFVALGDFNDDGKSDFVTVDQASSSASVLLGNGDGTFQSRVVVTTGSGGNGVAVGDFNDDGKLDFVTAESLASTASILIGNGDGTFQARVSIVTGSFPASVVVGDLNGDGISDLVTGDSGSPTTVSIFLGNGIRSSINTIGGINLSTLADARSAQGQIDTILTKVHRVSSAIGSSLSRLRVAATVSNVIADTSKAAESRIRDADIASEAAQLSSSRILQQAATAVLAHANQQPAIALQLLR